MGFISGCVCVNTTVWMYHMDANKMQGEKVRWELPMNVTSYFEQILEATPHETTAVQPLTSNLKNFPSKTDMWDTAGKVKNKLISDVLLWTPTHKCASVD